MAKYRVDIEAFDKTKKGVESAKKNLRTLGDRQGVGTDANKQKQEMRRFGRQYTQQVVGPALKKGVIDPFKKNVVEPFKKKVVDPFKKNVFDPMRTNMGATIKKGLVDPFNKKVAMPMQKTFSGFQQKVVSPMQQRLGFMRQRPMMPQQVGGKGGRTQTGQAQGITGGLARKVSGIAFGIGAAIGIPVSMVNALGKRFDQLQQEQQETMRLIGGGGMIKGSEGFGLTGAQIAESRVGVARVGEGLNARGLAKRLAGVYGLGSEEAGRISALQQFMNFGGGGGGMNARLMRGSGLNRAQTQDQIRALGGILEDAISKGFRTSSEQVVRGMTMIQTIRMGGTDRQISAQEARSITQNLQQGFTGAANLTGDARQGLMFEAVRRQMAGQAEGGKVDMIELMKRLEQGATAENIKALETLIQERYGNNRTARILATKNLLGTSTATAQDIAEQGLTEATPAATADASRVAPATRREIARRNLVRSEGGRLAAQARDVVETGFIKAAEGMTNGVKAMADQIKDWMDNGLKVDMGLFEITIIEGSKTKQGTAKQIK